MKEVYFITNVYDLLDELIQTKSFALVDKLRRAVRSDHVRVYTNVIPIQETLGALKDKPAEGRRRLRLIRTLAKGKQMNWDSLTVRRISYVADFWTARVQQL